jgi:hypothetical protein
MLGKIMWHKATCSRAVLAVSRLGSNREEIIRITCPVFVSPILRLPGMRG